MTEEKKKRDIKAVPPAAAEEKAKDPISQENAGEGIIEAEPEVKAKEPASQENIEEEVIEAVPVEKEMITLPAEEFTDLTTKLAAVQKQSKEYFEGWQRERADFINYKKRVERDQSNLHQVISANVIKKFLAILDDMELAIKNKPADAADQNWWNGMELISRKLQGILEAEGVTRIPAEFEFFDPNRHEAISHEENDDYKSGQIIEVVKQGYTMGDKVIRPALVRVAR